MAEGGGGQLGALPQLGGWAVGDVGGGCACPESFKNWPKSGRQTS